MTNSSQQNERFNELLGIIREHVISLKSEIKTLKKENNRLKQKIEDMQGNQTDIMSAISETERIALRNQVSGLISKIDKYIDNDHEIH